MLIHEIAVEQTILNSSDLFEIEDGITGESKYIKAKNVNCKVLEIDNANHTILDTELYDVYVFKNLTANRYLYWPTLADNQGRRFAVINLSSTYKVINTPEGVELINDYNTTFEITEKGGRLDVVGLSTHWEATPNENCCIYEVSSETEDAGLSLTGAWDDVEGMALNMSGIRGDFLISSEVAHYYEDTSYVAYLVGYFGIGTLSGNNAPNIPGLYDYTDSVRTTANIMHERFVSRKIIDKPYTVSANITLYMKLKAISDELNISAHIARGITNCPMYIRARRTR